MVKDILQEKINTALKAGDAIKVSTYRMLLSALNNEKIAKQHDLSEDEEMSVIKRQLKQREEAVVAYEEAGRTESAQKEKEEAKLLKEFLPDQLENTQIEQIVEQMITDTGALGMSDFGKVMQATVVQVKGQADGKIIAEIVKQKLSA